MKREVPVSLSVDDQDGDVEVGCQPDRAYLIHPEPVKDIHPEDDHGAKDDPEELVITPIQASQGLLRPCVAALEEKERYPIRIPVGCNDGACRPGRMAVEQDRLTNPIQNRLYVFGEAVCVHKVVGGGTPVIPRTVHDRGESHIRKNPGPVNHAIPISAPAVSQNDNTP